MCTATDGESKEIEITYTCRFHIGQPTTLQTGPLARGKVDCIVAGGLADMLSFESHYILATSFATKPVHLPRKMVIARTTEFPTIKDQPSRPLDWPTMMDR